MTLKVAVLVKQVPDHEASIQVQADGTLAIEERWVCSFFDEIAMEAALNLRQAHPGTELLALSAGGRRAVDALRRAIAMGFDEVEQVGDERLDRAESFTLAKALAERLARAQPQIVLCGKQAGDDDQAAVGPMVAELLGIPHVSAAVALRVDPAAGSVEVGRKTEGEIWTLRANLPLLLTADKGLAAPHIPVVTRVMKAMKAKIPASTLPEPADPGARAMMRRLRFQPPPARPPVRMMQKAFPENVAELLSCLEQAGVLHGS